MIEFLPIEANQGSFFSSQQSGIIREKSLMNGLLVMKNIIAMLKLKYLALSQVVTSWDVKKLIFLSLSYSHEMRDLCFQNDSSCCTSQSSWSFKFILFVLSSALRVLDFLSKSKALIWLQIEVFLWVILPTDCLLYFLSLNLG